MEGSKKKGKSRHLNDVNKKKNIKDSQQLEGVGVAIPPRMPAGGTTRGGNGSSLFGMLPAEEKKKELIVVL